MAYRTQPGDPLDRIEYHVGHLRSLWRGGVVRDLAESEAGYESALREIRGAVDALLAAPMPERESIHKGDEWAERYGDWWHAHVRRHVIGERYAAASTFPRTGLSMNEED